MLILIKLLRTLLFLVFLVVLTLLAQKVQSTATAVIRSGRKRTLTLFFAGIGMALLSLGMFWSLTGLFSFTGVLALIALVVLGHLLYQVVGAISGFTLPQNEQKINTLGFIMGVLIGMTGKWLLVIMGLNLLNILAMLIVFWIYPFRDPMAVVLLTLLQFVVSQVISATMIIMMSWPVVASEHVDNDIRDSHLTAMFAQLFNQTALLLIGVTLAEPSIRIVFAQRHWPVPNLLLVVALPMVAFIFSGVFPFFIGIYRRRAEEKRVTQWYVDWLNKLSQLLKLPDGNVRYQALTNQFQELNDEITSRYANNELYEFYEEKFHEVTVEHHPEFDDNQNARLLTGQVQPDPSGAVKTLRRTLPGVPLPPARAAYDIVARNYENLFKWDLRFQHLRNMLQLRAIIVMQPNPAELAPYVDAQLGTARETVKVSGQVRSVVAATVLAGFSWLAGWAATNYGKTIVEMIRRAVTS